MGISLVIIDNSRKLKLKQVKGQRFLFVCIWYVCKIKLKFWTFNYLIILCHRWQLWNFLMYKMQRICIVGLVAESK